MRNRFKSVALILLLACCSGWQVASAQSCGDALLDVGETCDDGNSTGSDGCSASCQIEASYECTLPTPPSQLNGIEDGGFEGGTPSTGWTEASTGFGTPLCTEAECGLGNGTGPRTGDWWIWFGGSLSTENASMEQQVLIEAGDAALTFWLEIPACDSVDDFMRVTIDGNEVFRVEGDDALCESVGYTQKSVDLTSSPGGPYNNDALHSIRFEVQTVSTAGDVSSFFVDDVLIDRGASEPVPSDCTAFDSCFAEDFDPGTGGLPITWTIFENAPQSNNWGSTDDGVCGSGPNGDNANFTGGSGDAACIDSDAIGRAVEAYMCSDAIELTAASGSRLQFLFNYQVFQSTSADVFDVLVGTATPDLGNMAGYTTVYSAGGASKGASFATPGSKEIIDLAPFQGSSIYVCYRYDADDDYYAQVDDVEVRADSCDGGPPPQPPVSPPGNISASDALYTDRVRISWSDVSDETSYEVYRCSSSDNTGSCGTAITNTAGNVTTYSDSGADANGLIHHYRLKACNAAGCSGFSEADAGNRLYIPPPPSVPGNVSASDGAFANLVRITWGNVSGEDEFRVFRCADSVDTVSCQQIATPAANVLTYDDTGASPDGSVFYYRLMACSAAGGCSLPGSPDAGNRLQVCGDAILGIGEFCDDGNSQGGDGCSASCQVETNHECSLPTPPVLINALIDGGFEAGTPNAFWTEASDTFGTPLCDSALCTPPASVGPNSGDWWAWFGGTGDPETASLQQSATIGIADEELSFWFQPDDCDSGADYFSVSLDGNEVYRFAGDDEACGASAYGRHTIDLNSAAGGPYNDNGEHVLLLSARTFGNSGGGSNLLIDDIVIGQGYTAAIPSVCAAYETCFSEDFDPGSGGLPAGWTIFEDAPQPHNWGTTDDGICGSINGDPGNVTGATGVAACVDSDAAGGQVNAYLCTDAIDLTSAVDSRLRFLYNYQFSGTAAADDIFNVLVGTEVPGIGTIGSYTPVLSTGGTSQGGLFALPGASESLDLSPYQGSTVYICFHYGGDNDWYAQVDDIELRAAACSVATPPPAVPAGLAASDGLYTDRVEVAWNNVAGEDNFEVYRCANGNNTGTCNLIASPAANVLNYNDNGALEDGTVHYYRVKACHDSNGCSALSGADAGNRQPAVIPPPAIPTGISASDGTYTDRVTIIWSNVTGEDSYQVFRCINGTDTAGCSLIGTTNANELVFDDTGANADGTLHYYRVKACHDTNGCSDFSLANAGRRDVPVTPPPEVPGSVSASDAAFLDKVAVSWADVSGEEYYLVYRCTNSSNTGTCSDIRSNGSNVTSYDDNEANADGTVHYYRVKACHNSNGCSEFSVPDAGNRDTEPLTDLILRDGFESN